MTVFQCAQFYNQKSYLFYPVTELGKYRWQKSFEVANNQGWEGQTDCFCILFTNRISSLNMQDEFT